MNVIAFIAAYLFVGMVIFPWLPTPTYQLKHSTLYKMGFLLFYPLLLIVALSFITLIFVIDLFERFSYLFHNKYKDFSRKK